MIVHIPEVLDQVQLARCREVMNRAALVDGRVTAGHQSRQVKNNLQLPEGADEHRELGEIVVRALQRSPLFISAALPHSIFPPLFSRYEAGMGFGLHVDNAVRQTTDGTIRIRTDISATLFLSGPDEYDGGELVVEDAYGSHAIKLPASDLVVYPADSRHEVSPITRGSRIVSFFWIQSLVPDNARRALLFDLDAAIMQLTKDVPGHLALVSLTATYHNLLRQWAQV